VCCLSQACTGTWRGSPAHVWFGRHISTLAAALLATCGRGSSNIHAAMGLLLLSHKESWLLSAGSWTWRSPWWQQHQHLPRVVSLVMRGLAGCPQTSTTPASPQQLISCQLHMRQVYHSRGAAACQREAPEGQAAVCWDAGGGRPVGVEGGGVGVSEVTYGHGDAPVRVACACLRRSTREISGKITCGRRHGRMSVYALDTTQSDLRTLHGQLMTRA
jgi:hypothetical protein